MKADLSTDRQAVVAAIYDEVIAAGANDIDSRRALKTFGIDILSADGQNRLGDVTPICRWYFFAERVLICIQN